MARYNINYGTPYVPPPPKEEKPPAQDSDQQQNEKQSLGKRKLPAQPPAWFDIDETQNTKVSDKLKFYYLYKNSIIIIYLAP